MCLGRLEWIVGSLKSLYASEASDCVSLSSVNASEVSDKEVCSSKDLYLPTVACASKVPVGSGINAF